MGDVIVYTYASSGQPARLRPQTMRGRTTVGAGSDVPDYATAWQKLPWLRSFKERGESTYAICVGLWRTSAKKREVTVLSSSVRTFDTEDILAVLLEWDRRGCLEMESRRCSSCRCSVRPIPQLIMHNRFTQEAINDVRVHPGYCFGRTIDGV